MFTLIVSQCVVVFKTEQFTFPGLLLPDLYPGELGRIVSSWHDMYPCIPRLLLGFFNTLNEMRVCKKSWGEARETNHNYTSLCIMLGAHYLALLCGKLYTQAFMVETVQQLTFQTQPICLPTVK